MGAVGVHLRLMVSEIRYGLMLKAAIYTVAIGGSWSTLWRIIPPLVGAAGVQWLIIDVLLIKNT
jgi:hypothetical protein